MAKTTLLAVAFVLFLGSLGVYGRTLAAAGIAFDGYDHSFETAHVASGDRDVERGY
jgi:hypothetical protein